MSFINESEDNMIDTVYTYENDNSSLNKFEINNDEIEMEDINDVNLIIDDDFPDEIKPYNMFIIEELDEGEINDLDIEVEKSKEDKANDLEIKSEELEVYEANGLETEVEESKAEETNDSEIEAEESEVDEANGSDMEEEEFEEDKANDLETEPEEAEADETNDLETELEETEAEETNDLEIEAEESKVDEANDLDAELEESDVDNTNNSDTEVKDLDEDKANALDAKPEKSDADKSSALDTNPEDSAANPVTTADDHIKDFQHITIENNVAEEDSVEEIQDPASISGIVWADKNKNGIPDSDEHGHSYVFVHLYSYPKNELRYTAITDENGRYIIKNIRAGEYRAVFSNIPNEYSFITAKGYVTDTGVYTKILDIESGKDYTDINASIELRMPPAATQRNSLSYNQYLNISVVERQVVAVRRSVNLGHKTERHHRIWTDGADLKIAHGHTYLVNYIANVKFAEEFNMDDYVALQFMVNGMYISDGLAYTKNQGIINSTCLIYAPESNKSNNESIVNLVNVGTKIVRMDNLTMTVVRIS